ncbi:MAG: hypothetical protein ABSG43_05240 [Solirubrobacteraceae bacterium]
MTDPSQAPVFHVELRQFPHAARAFNLSRSELERRILGPWTSGQPVALDDRRFSPDRARLTVYQGPALDPAEMGLGRGWANATRTGEDATARLLDEAQRSGPAAIAQSLLAQLRRRLLERCAQPLAVSDVPLIAGELQPGALVSERLALAERAIWELLHHGRLQLLSATAGAVVVGPEEWQATLLAWDTWATRAVAIQAIRPTQPESPDAERVAPASAGLGS